MPSFIFTLILGLSVFISSGFIPAPVFSQNQKMPVAILELKVKGTAEPSEGSLITDRIRSLVVKSRRYDVMERALVDRILKEQGFQSTQNCGDSDNCSVRIGQLLAVKEIITGSLNKVGNFYSLTLRKIDVERGIILKEDFYDCRCDISKIITSALPDFINHFLKNDSVKRTENKEEATSVDTSQPNAQTLPLREKLNPDIGMNIRSRRPWLFMINGGLFPYVSGILQYNFNDYFSLYGGVSYTQLQTGSFFGYYSVPDGMIGTKIYFMSGNWSPYTDLSFSIQGFGTGLLGLEYRYEEGVTLALGAGWAANISDRGNGLALHAGLGYAF